MSQIVNAFNAILSFKKRKVIFERPGRIAPVEIYVSPSNYYRHLQGPEDITIVGQEFIVSKVVLLAAGIDRPRKGDRLEDAETGSSEITEAEPMYGLGDVLGYRIRTA